MEANQSCPWETTEQCPQEEASALDTWSWKKPVRGENFHTERGRSNRGYKD